MRLLPPKTKSMPKNQKLKSRAVVIKAKRQLLAVAASLLLVGSLSFGALVHADQYDEQIKVLQRQNASAQSHSDSLALQAHNYQEAINALQARINGLQQSIVSTQNNIDSLQAKIDKAQKQLEHEKLVLRENIRTMYLEGQISTLEILASSKDISQFVDRQEARNAVSSKLKQTLDEINALRAQLSKQQRQQKTLLAAQQLQQNQLQQSQSEKSQMLAYTAGQKAAYDKQIKANNAEIADLRAQQLAANARLVGSGSVSIVSSGNCGGGYPGDAVSAFGHWGCNYGLDQGVDNWGMYNRECVSYTAWRVYQQFGQSAMPYWGGVGNANQWPADADNYGIPRGSQPRVHSVAIGTNPYYFGSLGHAMWVEAVSGNQILVSQMNFSAPGVYSQMWISSSLINTFIYFGR